MENPSKRIIFDLSTFHPVIRPVARAVFDRWNFSLEGKMAGGGAPGGLPLIDRFSRSQACSLPVSLPLRAGTLILVNFF
jgi:hypothetical protein